MIPECSLQWPFSKGLIFFITAIKNQISEFPFSSFLSDCFTLSIFMFHEKPL